MLYNLSAVDATKGRMATHKSLPLVENSGKTKILKHYIATETEESTIISLFM
jgi:hypothetical protein